MPAQIQKIPRYMSLEQRRSAAVVGDGNIYARKENLLIDKQILSK